VGKMHDFGPIVLVSILAASCIVVMWRQILIGFIVVCLTIVFVGLLGFTLEAKSLLTHASSHRLHNLQPLCALYEAPPTAHSMNPSYPQSCQPELSTVSPVGAASLSDAHIMRPAGNSAIWGNFCGRYWVLKQ
jgi:hypothetical protein